MIKRNALIFSKNENISKIISGELSLLGYIPQTLDCPPPENDADIIIFDTTELDITSAFKSFLKLCNNTRRIAVIDNISEKPQIKFDEVFSFPFSLADFRDALLTSNTSEQSLSESSEIKCFISDEDKCGVFFKDIYIPLSDSEFKLLELLCKNSGNCVTKEELLNLFDTRDSNILQVYICHLRAKLEQPFGIKVIYTVRGSGYTTDYTIA